MRYEIKYALDPPSLVDFSQWLAGAGWFRRAYPKRRVHSVYFDTAEMSAARDNLAGISLRNKYRVRWYSSLCHNPISSQSTPRFEIKSKQGRLGWKTGHVLETIKAETIPEWNGQTLNQNLRTSLTGEQWSNRRQPLDFLAPKLLVEYERAYYVGPEAMRVTVDENICFGDVLSNAHARLISQSSYSKAIIEFKFPLESQNQAAELMSSLPFYPVRSSKYLTGLGLFGHAVYM